MASPSNAEAHIERLRAELGPQFHPRLASLMTNAVDLVVSQLYDRSTHFILEFLQNLEDTGYEDSVTPAVKFTYTPGRLRIDSNQIGFSPKDIDGICAIGSSTKVNQPLSIQSIGEKGIGFKSVFRVANKVWLSSRNYSIRWDRAAELGALTPEWATFPESVEDGETSFLCELDRDEQEGQIIDYFENFDASLILFLQRIRRVDMEVRREDGRILAKSIIRNDIENMDFFMSILQDENAESPYLKSIFTALDLPKEPKRRGSPASELVLAFPLQQDPKTAPPTSRHNVSSGLPVGDYGLKFRLNADFILTASRQTIDISRPWNMALRDALSPALVNAFVHLSLSPCKYIWPWFTTAAAASPFFEPALRDARRAFASRCTLESYDGQLRLPTDLAYVDPTHFAGEDGYPLTLSHATEARYLSSKYPTWTIDSTIDLGVRRLTNQDFLQDLTHMLADDPEGFRSRSPKWHEDLAAALLPLVDVPELKEVIRQLKLVPLLDGGWSNIEIRKGERAPRPIFWPLDVNLQGSEKKLGFSVIDSKSLVGVKRRNLFERLDVKTLEPQRICLAILAAHAANGPGSFSDPSVIGTCELISHALLLHRESWTPRAHQTPELWLVSADGTRHRGPELYFIRDAEGTSQRNGAGILQELSPKLHTDYFTERSLNHNSESSSPADIHISPSQEDVVTYLARTFRVSSVPRLVVTSTTNACDFYLAEEFRDLFETHHASQIFQLVLDNWDLYSPWIELNGSHRDCRKCTRSRESLLEDISKSPSHAEHGPNTRILDTVLPDIDPFILEAGVPLAVPKVLNFEDTAVRYRLQYLGVITHKGYAFYLKCLQALKKQRSPPAQCVSYVYQQIQTYFADGKDQIEDDFLKERLIFLNAKSPISGEMFRGWASISECIKMGIRLEKLYPRSARLFQTLQAADSLEVDEMITGIISLSVDISNDLIPLLVKSLTQLSKAVGSLSQLGVATTLEPLRSTPIFPVNMGGSSSSPKFRSSQDRDWYIADRPHLRDSFKGIVHLLDLPATEADQMDDLFSCLGLSSRKLSLCVTTKTDAKGPIKLLASDTMLLQSRAPFFEALTSSSDLRKRTVSDRISNATVSSAADIVDTHFLNGECVLQGRNTRSQAVWSIEGTQLRLFVSAKSTSAVPLIYLSEHLREFCGIENPQHAWLLHILLTEPVDDEIEIAFAKQGMHIELPKKTHDEHESSAEDTFWRYASNALDLPDPFDFRDSDAENSDGEQLGHDLLQNFQSKTGRRLRGDRRKAKKDRRLNLMRHRYENDLEDDLRSSVKHSSTGLDPNSNLKFLGEQLVSLFFQRELGNSYEPVHCWTSQLRTRAGLPGFPTEAHHASFTVSDPGAARKVTEFLSHRGWKSLALYSRAPPAYHFDVGVSAGGLDDTFEWNTSQLLMAQDYRYLNPQANGKPSHDNVHVLIRITDAYTEPKFSLILDPWTHFNSGMLQFQPGFALPMSLQLPSFQPRNDSAEEFSNPDTRPDPGVNIRSSRASTGDNSTHLNIQDTAGTSSLDAQISPPAQCKDIEISPMNTQNQQRLMRSYPKDLSGNPAERKRKPRDNSPEMRPPAKRITSVRGTSYSYRYTRLLESEIRLFTLFPGEDTQMLQGMLWTTTTKMAGSYKTLSYVWGPEDQPKHDLSTPSGVLTIRDALHAALVSLRHRREPLTLWVDALCINQADRLEKAQQILLLAEIFQRSASTLAFIGGKDDYCEALQVLMQARARMVLGPSSKEWPEELPRCPESWEERGIPSAEDPIWTRITAFFQNPWFRRAWIVQEAVIARRLQIVNGNTRIDWNHLFLVMDHIDKELERTDETESDSWLPFLKLGRLRHIEDRSGRVSILKLLENFRHAKASDPRDKFFSLLGIASDGNLEEFEPDYNSSLTEITQRFATALFRRFSEQRQAMLLLYHSGLSPSDNLPSWVPDWLGEKPNGLHDSLGRGNAFNACGDTAEQIQFVPDTNDLEVEAYAIDEVEYVTQSCNGLERLEQRQYLAEVKGLLDRVFGEIWDNEKIQRALRETPIAGAKHPKVALPGDLSVQDSWRAFVRLLEMDWVDEDGEEDSEDDEDEESDDDEEDEDEEDNQETFEEPEWYPLDEDDSGLDTKSRVYQSLLADEVRDWRFVILKGRNLCGIAPNIVQEGDTVHIFHGGVVPFITRRSEDKEGTYRLIGQCYIWGMMQGEGLTYDDLVQETVRLH